MGKDFNDVGREHGNDEGRRQFDAGVAANQAKRKAQGNGAAADAQSTTWRSKTVTFTSLQKMTFNPFKFAVQGLVPSEGVTLICSKPKIGKSWLLLDLCIGATADRFVLGEIKPQQGSVLYLALEDSLRRLQSRGSKLLPTFTGQWPEGLTVAIDWRRVDQGGLDDIREWVNETRKAGRNVVFVAVDVLRMVRPPNQGKQSAYENDYQAIMGLHQLAMELGIAILIAHHTRKQEADDLIDMVNGTFGLTGASDTIIVIDRKSQGAIFDVRGRDVEGNELAVEFNKATCRWTILGAAKEVHRNDTRKQILAALANGPLTPAAVTRATGCNSSTVRVTLGRMAEDGEIQHFDGGKWGLPTDPTYPM
jgi:hypothetical protein